MWRERGREGEGPREATGAISNSSVTGRHHKHEYKLYRHVICKYTYLLLKATQYLVPIDIRDIWDDLVV